MNLVVLDKINFRNFWYVYFCVFKGDKLFIFCIFKRYIIENVK